jgi:hypothetical protein
MRIAVTVLFILTSIVFCATFLFQKGKEDNTVPVITIETDFIEVKCAATNKDLLKGVTATDEKDGDLTDEVIVESVSRFIEPGVCVVKYAVCDSNNHVARATRKVKYTDYEAPKFKLKNSLCFSLYENANISSSVWHQLFLGQHHGLPTRILDWTYSPLVALHFACSSTDYQNFENQDFALWKISVEEINKLLPKKYQDQLEREASYLFTVKTLSKIAPSLNEYDYDMGTTSMAIIEPPSIDPRIINQYSIFTIVPRGISNVETFLNDYTFESYKYTISKELRWQLRDLLDSFNINERIIYPGLNGIAQWLARHYYVK